MSVMLKTVILVTGIIVLLNLGGVETNSGGIAKQFLDGGLANFGNSTIWNGMLLILALSLGVGAVASLFGRSPDIAWALATLVSTFGGLVLADMISIYSILWSLNESWIRGIASAIFIPLAIGFIVIIVNFWRGSDN